MSFVKIWIHLVFSTKNRQPLILPSFKNQLYDHIRANCKQKGIYLKEVGGHVEHIHCLISLGKDQTISKITQLIKGESSFWIGRENLTKQAFSWQDDYFAVSVSESQVEAVTNYIRNQEKHHARKSFNDEVDEFMNAYGWTHIID